MGFCYRTPFVLCFNQPEVCWLARYGVSSLVFRAKRPFHPRRLRRILAGFASVDGFGSATTEDQSTGGIEGTRCWRGDLDSCEDGSEE